MLIHSDCRLSIPRFGLWRIAIVFSLASILLSSGCTSSKLGDIDLDSCRQVPRSVSTVTPRAISAEGMSPCPTFENASVNCYSEIEQPPIITKLDCTNQNQGSGETGSDQEPNEH